MPFIKLNPGSRKEKLYRIFTTSISSDGRKIPYLSKAVILKLSRDIGKTKRLALFIERWVNWLNRKIVNFVTLVIASSNLALSKYNFCI